MKNFWWLLVSASLLGSAAAVSKHQHARVMPGLIFSKTSSLARDEETGPSDPITTQANQTRGLLLRDSREPVIVLDDGRFSKFTLVISILVFLCGHGVCRLLVYRWASEGTDYKHERSGSQLEGGHRVPWEEFMALGSFLFLLLAGAALTRLVCQFGVPLDCHQREDKTKLAESLNTLVYMGFILASLTRVHQQDRFSYIFCLDRRCPRGILFIVVFMSTPPVYGSLDLVPALSRMSISIPSGSDMLSGTVMILLLIVAALFLVLVLWHFVHCFMNNSMAGFMAYVGARATVWLLYYIRWWAVHETSDATFRFHHYMIGFILAILAEFNHPISLLLLAIGTGIMVQGIAAYDADPIFNKAQTVCD